MIRASIDLGTNTCLLLISEWDASTQEVRSIVEDHATVVRLGQGVDQNRTLHPDAVTRTLNCLTRYSEIVRKHGLDPAKATCVATSQARDAENGPDFFKQVEQKTGFRFQVITGDQEAQYTFLGALLPGMNPESVAVIDIGGGSTEFMSTRGGQSLDIGSVRFTERYLKSDPVQDSEFWACQEAIDAQLEKMKSWRAEQKKDLELVAVAGTATTLASWFLELKEYDRGQIDQCTLSRGDLHRLVEELKWRNVAEREQLVGIEKGRADVLLAGALILWRATELLDFPKIRISTRGLRFGVLRLPG